MHARRMLRRCTHVAAATCPNGKIDLKASKCTCNTGYANHVNDGSWISGSFYPPCVRKFTLPSSMTLLCCH